MSFGQPLALLALLALIPVLNVWAYTGWRRRRADAAYGGPAALRRGLSRPRTVARAALLLGAVTLVAFAIARPQWGGTESPLTRRGIDVVIALDISRSMSATDVQPTRAAAAAAGLNDMLRHVRGDRVGLVTFGGSAFPRSPLTLDLGAIGFLVNRAQAEGALVEPGTDIGKAISASLQLLDVPDRAQAQAIVVISDGEDLGQDLDGAIGAAKQQGIRIYTVAVGTDQGSAVPGRTAAARQPSPGDESNVSRADRATLGRIASMTGGETREAQGIAGLAVEFARLQQTNFEEAPETIPAERLQWFLGGAVALLLAQWLTAEGRRPALPLAVTRRRTLELAGPLSMLLLAALIAGCGGTAGYRKVQEGNDAYAGGRYEEALTAYQEAKELLPDDPIVDYNIGNALHRLQRYPEATAASRAAAQEADRSDDAATFVRAMYATGNHALQSEALEEARDAYIEVLLRDHSDGDAKHNLELVLRLLGAPEPPSTGATPTPTGQPGGASTAPAGSPTPGQGGGPHSGSPSPSPGQPGGTVAPGGTPAAGAPPQPATESLAAQLERLLADGVNLEEALAILDRLRRESEAAGLQPRGPGDAGGLPDR